MEKRTTIQKLWIGIALLAILAPLGLIIPALFGAGGAWGEWGVEEIKDLIGYVPSGMEKLSDFWSSPLPDYTVPGQKPGLLHESISYVLAAIIGITVTAGFAYVLARIVGRKE